MSAGDMGKVLGKCLKAGEDPAVQAEAKATVAAAMRTGLVHFGDPPTTNQPPRHKKAGIPPGASVAMPDTGKVVELHPVCLVCRKREPYCRCRR